MIKTARLPHGTVRLSVGELPRPILTLIPDEKDTLPVIREYAWWEGDRAEQDFETIAGMGIERRNSIKTKGQGVK